MDFTLLLDLNPEIGLSRAHIRENCSIQKDRFEEQDLSFHIKIRESFLQLAADNPHRFRVIDASQEAATIHNRIVKILRDEFELL